MSDIKKKVCVDADALYEVLMALNVSNHFVGELQATRDKPPVLVGNPIDLLIKQYNEWAQEENRS